jgi:predicted nucleotide-binding protein
VNITENLNYFVEMAFNTQEKEGLAWKQRVSAFLRAAGLADACTEFEKLGVAGWPWTNERALLVGLLEGLAAARSEPLTQLAESVDVSFTPRKAKTQHSKQVFIVHGHETEAKESVARFLDRLGLEPIILHEQPSSGRTVIEKFETFADVGFAVVLLTPDDIGGLAADPANLKRRARQNVILELGYFLGKLSRRRVCALYRQGVEIPSDYQGVLYIEFDAAGAWRTKVAQELVEAGFSINLESLLK